MRRKKTTNSPGKKSSRYSTSMKKRLSSWGPFLSDRQWGTVREDRTTCNNSWGSLNFYESDKTSYACGEDGLFGISDEECRLCFAYCFFNNKDERVKEKLFGMGGPEGNHGEDVKELYFYRTHTPSHNYMKATYMYPMREFPYKNLTRNNSNRETDEDEYEIWDTDCFCDGWWQLDVTYMNRKNGVVISTLRAKNCSNLTAALSIIPTVWFRNTWSSLFCTSQYNRPTIRVISSKILLCHHIELGEVYIAIESDSLRFILTENESCLSPKDANSKSTRQVIDGIGTKCYAIVPVCAEPKETVELRARILTHLPDLKATSRVLRTSTSLRRAANSFYDQILSWVPSKQADLRKILKFALSGLLWNKQYYEYDVCKSNRVRTLSFGKGAVWNKNWKHFNAKAILSMPDKWEFPWFASWDLCLQMIPFSEIDPFFAQNQLKLLLSPSFMSPDGQLPGCEYNFDDPNPPLQGFAVLHVFNKTNDWNFLREIYPRLFLSLRWWWNRRQHLSDRSDEFKDGIYFTAGFLGLDNIAPINRSHVPLGYRLFQCDAFSWIFLLTLNCLEVYLLLSSQNKGIIDISHFEELFNMLVEMQRGFRHFHDNLGCDLLLRPDGSIHRLNIKSYVALTPLFASSTIKSTPLLRRCLQLQPLLHFHLGRSTTRISLLSPRQTEALLHTLCSPNSLISPFGIRSLSKEYEESPFEIEVNGESLKLQYCPGESSSNMFGGNSNWRGPVWIPMNFLLIDALRNLSLESDLRLMCLSMHGQEMNINSLWRMISKCVINIFERDDFGRRPVHGNCLMFKENGSWSGPECVLFYEFFHGDTGRGCGASHQTGWTSLVTNIAKFFFSKDPSPHK